MIKLAHIIGLSGAIAAMSWASAAYASGPLTGWSVGLNISKPVYSKQADTVYFKFTAINDGNTNFKKVVMGFTPNVRPWGLVDGHLVFGPGGRALRWNIGTLHAGESVSITIPIQAPQKMPARFCVSASLRSAEFSAIWARNACITTY